eukprot:1577810-Amphidinium_carterae.2
MQLALDSQSYTTFAEVSNHDVEGRPLPLALDSQSHTTTASYMSDVESCSWVLQHDSVMQRSPRVTAVTVAASRTQKKRGSQQPTSAQTCQVSCERGEPVEELIIRPQSPRGRVPPPPPHHGRHRDEPPLEKQMPVPVVRRVIAPQPPPPPVVRIIPAQPQPPQQQATAVQTQMVGILPRPKPEPVAQPKTVEKARQQHGGQRNTDTAAAHSATAHAETCAPATTSPAQAPGSPEQKKHIELVYHGSFAPFHLGHLAVVEAAVRLVQTAMKPAVVTTWISMTSAKYLLRKGEAPDPVLKRHSHGPNRCSMIDAVCSTSEFRIHIIPREFATSAEMFQHVQLQTPNSVHIYLAGSDTTPKLTDQTVTVWRDPNKNLTQFSIRRLAGTAVQRTHHGISSTQIRLAIIDKDWQKVTQMCGEAATVEARRMAATIPAAELEQN